MRVLSLFSGVGGLDLGVKLALPEARVVGYVEKDDHCRRILAARMRDGWLDEAPIHDDITTFDGSGRRGAVDLICGGFPCQDISDAGRREGLREGNRSGLWFEFARVIREVGPRYVFVENVAALLGRGMGDVLGGLSGLGFDAEWGVVSACAVGAPHTRERLFLLAYSAGADGRFLLEQVVCRGSQVSIGGSYCSPLDHVGKQASFWAGEPGLHGMADRTARGVERLGAIGNSVVPLAAARAFCALAARIGAYQS